MNLTKTKESLELLPDSHNGKEPKVSKDSDISLGCRQCGRKFVFTKGEQEFYEMKGFTPPTRCKDCRSTKAIPSHHLICARCGIELEKDSSVYCETCLKNVQLDSERKINKSRKVASAAQAKLQIAECQNAELQRLLSEAGQLVAELEFKVKNLSQDLDKAHQFYVASGWLQPALSDVKERLKALEQAQGESDQRIFHAIRLMKETCENTSLWGIMRRSLIPYRRHAAQTRLGCPHF